MIKDIEDLKASISSNLNEILELKSAMKQLEIEKYDLTKEFFIGIIELIDSYENKETNLLERNKENEPAKKVIQSFGIIKKKMTNLLSRYGVSQIEFPENRLILGFSKVVGTEPDRSRNDDSIVSVVRNGYIRGHELIREAEVIVVKN